MAEGWPFIGPLTRGQAVMFYGSDICEELNRFVPEQCRDCYWHLEAGVIGRLATRVVLDELTTVEAARQVVDYTADCTGSRPNPHYTDSPPICPKEEQEKRRGQTICW